MAEFWNFNYTFKLRGDVKKQKQMVILGGAQHKVDDLPTSQAVVIKLPLFVGGDFFFA